MRPAALEPAEAVGGIRPFVAAGLDAIEVSSNLMGDYERASIVPYVAVDSRRALEDLLLHRLLKPRRPRRTSCRTRVCTSGARHEDHPRRRPPPNRNDGAILEQARPTLWRSLDR